MISQNLKSAIENKKNEWIYAINFLIEESIYADDLIENNVPLRDFYQHREDGVETFISQLNYMGILYGEERKKAEELLLLICDAFEDMWKGKHQWEDLGDSCFFLAACSALGHGTGLWEIIGEDGEYPSIEDGIDSSELVEKIIAWYNDAE